MPDGQMPRRLLIPVIALAAFAGAFYKAARIPVAAPFQAAVSPSTNKSVPHFASRFASSQLFVQVHAASAVELSDGRIRSFWFAGSREGAKDVAIRSAVFDPAQW